MANDELPVPLQENASDYAAAILRGTLGNIPIGGALISELVGRIIPDLREQRFLAYVAHLAKKIEETHQALDNLLNGLGPIKAALFEDGAFGAVRSTSTDRIEHLANLVAAGLLEDEREAEKQRSLVRLLNELTEADLRYLMLWTKKYNEDDDWRRLNGFNYQFEDRDGVSTSIGDSTDPIVEMYIQGRLESMGLMEKRVTQAYDHVMGAKRADKFEYETDISPQGLALLRRLGLIGSGDGSAYPGGSE